MVRQPRRADLGEDSDIKTGERPGFPDAVPATTVWAYDECDLCSPSQREVRSRAAHNLELLEPIAVERQLVARLMSDIVPGPPFPAPTLVEAVGPLEEAFAATGTIGSSSMPAPDCWLWPRVNG